MAHSQMNVVKFYQSVIDDVISGVRENFLDEGMDEQVLQELKQLWETKVLSSKAVEVADNSEPQPPQLLMTKGNGVSLGMVAKTVAMPGQTQILTPVTTSMHNANNSQLHLQQHHQTQQLQQQQQQQSHHQQQQQTLHQQLVHQQTQQTNAPPQPTQQTVIVADPNKTVPVQITLPAPAGTVTIHVPVSALQGNTLQTSLTGPVITAAMALPPAVATTLLQQHVLAALQAAQQQQQQSQQQQQQTAIQHIPRQTDGQDDSDRPGGSGLVLRNTEVILQLDGHNDTSDEEDEDVDDDGDDDDEDETEDRVDDDENEDEANGGGQEEEPLNSGDDVSEDDPTDLFDTDNVIVCQYDKITRSRNKWKFYLKDGIMNLNGKDFVFQKSNGDAEW